MNNHPPHKALGPVISRLADVMAHTNRYAFKGATRLASDLGLSRANIARIMRGSRNPSYPTVTRLVAALEQQLGMRLDPRDVFAEHGRFLTRHVCDVVGCRGCLPANAYDEDGALKPKFEGVKAGQWVHSKAPYGFAGREAA